MGLFFKKEVAPTGIEQISPSNRDEAVLSGDVEKDSGADVRQASTVTVVISPEIEKRVVRKIDLHVTPLVTFLCMETSDLPH